MKNDTLYVKDEQVAGLVIEYQKIVGAASKTEAVRMALQRQIAAERRSIPLAERIGDIQASVRALGPTDPSFDAKAFSDDMWEER